jgi:hypothetical protein
MSKIQGHANLKSYVTWFYKDLFGEPKESLFILNDSNNSYMPRASSLENEAEVKVALFSMEHNKAPSLNGFPVNHLNHQGNLIQTFSDLSKGDHPLFSLNFGVITLIPKI